MDGIDVANRPPAHAIRAGVSYIPEDRLGTGLALTLSVAENLIMKAYRGKELSAGPFLRHGRVLDWSRRLVDTFRIKTPSLDTPVSSLSGGNAQRVLLARETAARPRLIVAAHPTRPNGAAGKHCLAGGTENIGTRLVSQHREFHPRSGLVLQIIP